jgi:hypothetical protein
MRASGWRVPASRVQLAVLHRQEDPKTNPTPMECSDWFEWVDGHSVTWIPILEL